MLVTTTSTWSERRVFVGREHLQKGNSLIKSRLCRVMGAAAAAVAVVGVMQVAGASATPAPVKLTIVGSNTTQEVMGAITSTFDSSSVAKSANVAATNVYAIPGPKGKIAPSDANCNGGHSITYIAGANPGKNERTSPNGSSAGKTALATSVTNGDSCTSIARSSSPGSTTDPAGTQAYAYAVDAVTWTTSANSAAPSNLSMTNLEGVYDCKYTNWDQVGGSNAPIVRYYPQEGSGSGSFFAGVLGFDPRTLGGENTCSTAPTLIEENEATSITSNAADAIMIYSGGAWIAQANGVDTDMRNGFVLDTINGKGSPITKLSSGKYGTGAIVVQANVEPATYRPTSNTSVQGVRNLFNFINTNSVDYTAASSMVGSSSALCTDKDTAIVSKYGFHPLGHCLEQS
jgi:phosphate transport system substrate-binding protein